jgi:hypothetical protein
MQIAGVGRWQVVWNWRGWRLGNATASQGRYDGPTFTLWWFGPFELWRHGY